jgi:hypothetical protein
MIMLKKAMSALVVGLLFAAQGTFAMSASSAAHENTLQAQPDHSESPFPDTPLDTTN